MFSRGRERVHWEHMGWHVSSDYADMCLYKIKATKFIFSVTPTKVSGRDTFDSTSFFHPFCLNFYCSARTKIDSNRFLPLKYKAL